jgi:DNA polymerase-1
VPAALIDQLLDQLRVSGITRGDYLALTTAPGIGIGLATEAGQPMRAAGDPAQLVAAIEAEFRPRWVWWTNETPADLLPAGLRLATCWDLAAVHRLLFGGWMADPPRVWAALHELSEHAIPGMGQLDLLGQAGEEGDDLDESVRPDGHLRPEWASGGWRRDRERLARWAALAMTAAQLQRERLAALKVRGDALATGRSESAAELLCTELARDGLPVDRERAEQIIASFIGPRPSDEREAAEFRRRRDDQVLSLAPIGMGTDLRNPAQVRSLLARVGIEVPDTRSWRLEPFVGAHPVVAALLAWRKAERISTTYGYRWLDERIDADGRLRGAWSGCDGAAGRMTAQAGLHNLPAEMRPAVIAESGHVFVRADLGQIEPRILAAVSADPAFARAAAEEDLYAPVAARLNVDRPTAKVAVLAAMYGQRSGTAGQALRGLEAAYPVAMRYLQSANDAGKAGRDVRTHGSRLVRMWATPPNLDEVAMRSNIAARGRFARNAVIQGAAAEFFKAWAVTVRARGAALDARVVLCLHDELLVHTPIENGPATAALLRDCLAETAARWAPAGTVRFVADVSVIARWSDAKD